MKTLLRSGVLALVLFGGYAAFSHWHSFTYPP
jgi:hypothetical protein